MEPRWLIGEPLWWLADKIQDMRLPIEERVNIAGRLTKLGTRNWPKDGRG